MDHKAAFCTQFYDYVFGIKHLIKCKENAIF